MWGRRRRDPPAPPPPEPPEPTAEERVRERAKELSESLRRYAEASRVAAAGQPDDEHQAAKRKKQKALDLLRESGIAWALERVARDVKYWHAWSKNQPDKRWKSFDAIDISETEEKIQGEYREQQRVTARFKFNGSVCEFAVIDEGMSAAPGDPTKFGKLELKVEDALVLRVSLIQDLMEELSEWRIFDVWALSLGD